MFYRICAAELEFAAKVSPFVYGIARDAIKPARWNAFESVGEGSKIVNAAELVVFSTRRYEGKSLSCNTLLQYLRRNIGGVELGNWTSFQAK
jgi:hypothetical protein